MRKLFLTLTKYGQIRDLTENLFPTYFRVIKYDSNTLPRSVYDFSGMEITYSISYIDDRCYYYKPVKETGKVNLIIGRNFEKQLVKTDLPSFVHAFSDNNAWKIVKLLGNHALSFRELSKRLQLRYDILHNLIDSLTDAKIIDVEVIDRTVLYRLNIDCFQSIVDELTKVCGLPEKKHFVVRSDND